MRPVTKIGVGFTLAAIITTVTLFVAKTSPDKKTEQPVVNNETPTPAPAADSSTPKPAHEIRIPGKRPKPVNPVADSSALASPRPVTVRPDSERSFHPRSAEPTPTPAVNHTPAGERTGLATVEPKHQEPAPIATPQPAPTPVVSPVTPRETVTPTPAPALPEPTVAAPKVETPTAAPTPAPTPVVKGDTPPAVKADTKETLAVAPPPRMPEGTKEHVIQSGESYSSLSLKYFGSEKYALLIAKANPGKDARKLGIGAKIVIPPAPAAVASQPAPSVAGTASSVKKLRVPTEEPAATAATPVPPDKAYKVQPGESWHDLAQRFLGDGKRWTELYELNRERVPRNPSGLRPGMTIELPDKVSTTSKPS